MSQTCPDHSSFPEVNGSPASYISSPVLDLPKAPRPLPLPQERTPRHQEGSQHLRKMLSRLSQWLFGGFGYRAGSTGQGPVFTWSDLERLHLSLGDVVLCVTISQTMGKLVYVRCVVWIESRGVEGVGLCLRSAGEERVGRKVLRSNSEASNWSDNFGDLATEAQKGEEGTGRQRNRLEAGQVEGFRAVA